jgi:hypothetical protein
MNNKNISILLGIFLLFSIGINIYLWQNRDADNEIEVVEVLVKDEDPQREADKVLAWLNEFNSFVLTGQQTSETWLDTLKKYSSDESILADLQGIKETVRQSKGSDERASQIVEEYLALLEETEATEGEIEEKVDALSQMQQEIANIQNEAENQIRALELQLQKQEEKFREVLQSRQVARLTTKGGNDILYFGEVKNGKANGYGVGLWFNGSTYEGYWKDNERNGTGTFEWKDGERYEGAYLDGKRHGFGIYTWKNGDQYKGFWEGDLRHGKGVVYTKDGKPLEAGNYVKDRLRQKENPEDIFDQIDRRRDNG